MNAEIEVSRLLNESGAVLVRQSKHLVYRLPNGQNFVAAKTSSDPGRAAKNNLSQLRRALGLVREDQMMKGEKPAMPMAETVSGTSSGAVAESVETPGKESLKDRIEAAIGIEEAAQEKLLAEAQAHERKVQMLRALLPFAEEPMTEESLRAVLPFIEPPPLPKSAPVPEPPQRITERVQVTRQLVFAATQTFPGTFTVNDVLELMTGGKEIEPNERLRVRQSIAQAMVTLHERGELIREAVGYGKRQAIWRKTELNGSSAEGAAQL
jgi:hypothetical protein